MLSLRVDVLVCQTSKLDLIVYFDDFAATLSEGAGKFDGSEGSPNLKLAQEIFLKCPRIRIADPIAVLDKIEKELYKEFEDDHDLAHLPFEAFTISLPQATFIVSRGNGLCSRFVPESTFVYIEMAQSPEQRPLRSLLPRHSFAFFAC